MDNRNPAFYWKLGGYLRLSKDTGIAEKESSSIQTQRQLLEDYCGRVFPGSRIKIFVDDGCTGTNLNRPGLQRLLLLARQGGINCILVKDFSRFSRDYLTLGLYLEQLFPSWGVRFISINDRYDSGERMLPGLKLEEAFKSLLYDLYSQDLSVKVRASLDADRAQGKYPISNPPFGYRKNDNCRGGLEIWEPEAQVAAFLFHRAAEGYSSVEIAASLNRDQIPTPAMLQGKQKEGGFWEHTRICHMLRNPVYAGDLAYGKYRRSQVGGKNQWTTYRNWNICRDHHDPIVERVEFDLVQQILDEKQKRKRNYLQHNSIQA